LNTRYHVTFIPLSPQLLTGRLRRQVQVLVVLPVADLANQVFQVFSTYSRDTGLSVARLTGHKTFASEQRTLVKKTYVQRYRARQKLLITAPSK
jgi:ATP-dependent RNA helicase DDX51/DBP6